MCKQSFILYGVASFRMGYSLYYTLILFEIILTADYYLLKNFYRDVKAEN